MRNATEHAEADATGLRFCIVAAGWNEDIVSRLLDGARSALRERGAADGDVVVWRVPGSFELPTAALWAALAEPAFDAVIALGCIVRGETEHFRLVADGASQGLMRVALDTGVPVLNGVLAVENLEQALARCGGAHGHVGAEAAIGAVTMARLKPRGEDA